MWAVHSPNDALVAIKHSFDLTDLLDHRKGFAPAEWVTFLVATKWLRFTDVKRALYAIGDTATRTQEGGLEERVFNCALHLSSLGAYAPKPCGYCFRATP